MKLSVRNDWWVAPAGILAAWYAWVAAACWWAAIDIFELWPHGGPSSVLLLLVAVGFAGAAAGLITGIALRNRAPKVAGAVKLATLWPAFLWLAQWPGMPHFATTAIVVAVATAAGAIQNVIRRPSIQAYRPT